MNKILITANSGIVYRELVSSIGALLEKSRRKVYYDVNNVLIQTYWEIGRRMVEFEQKGGERAEYGTELLVQISRDLKIKYGKGFSRSNLQNMRQLYLKYQKCQTLSGELNWSHYVELLLVEDNLKRSFYEKQCIKEKWSVRELARQIDSLLFERLALSKNKKEVLALAHRGQILEDQGVLIKDPYILEFLGMPENQSYTEKELEQKIIENLQMFLLELGKGFAFIGRQFRITVNGTHFYVDLVFYHRILKCFVLIDLKIGKVSPADIGQMNLYLNYFKKEEMSTGDNEPIGLILSAEKNNLFVEYALGGLSNKLFVSKYQLYLPTKEELEREVKKLI